MGMFHNLVKIILNRTPCKVQVLSPFNFRAKLWTSVHCVPKPDILTGDLHNVCPLIFWLDLQPSLKHMRIVAKWWNTWKKYHRVLLVIFLFFMCWWACSAWLRVGLLSQSKAFQLYSGSFGNVNKLWKLNFNLWLIFTHHTWKRNANERRC